VFKHALVAETAYASMLHTEQRRLHAQIAARLPVVFPAVGTEQPELLAHHLAGAGEIDRSIDYWRQAGDAAIGRGAYQEAARHFDRGLELLGQLPHDSGRPTREIEMLESKGTALFSVLGYAHPLVEQTFARALTLCERDSSTPSLRALYGVWAVNISRGNREAVELLLPRFEALAKSGDPVATLSAYAHAGVYAFYLGDFTECVRQMTEANRWYATSEHSAFMKRHGYGGGIYPFAYRMWALAILGHSEAALAVEDELEGRARLSENPYAVAIAGAFRVNLARDRRTFETALELADRQVAYARRQMMPFWEGPALCGRGWARAHLASVDEGIADIRLGLQYLDAIGLRLTYPYHLAGLAEALVVSGDLAAALDAVRRAIVMSEGSLDRFYEAELCRLEGDILRELGDLPSAEQALRRAGEVAQRQSARFFLEHAHASLAQLFLRQGKDAPGGSVFTA
jgi:tetratricopeptide (TPR) repeat protein